MYNLHVIHKAKIYSRYKKYKNRLVVLCLKSIRCFFTPWSVALQASLSLEFSRQEFWRELPRPHLGYPPNPGIEPRFPTLQADSLSTEPPGRPINTGVGSLSLLQEIFLTHELNWGLLHCRWMYQLSYQGSP